MSDHSVNLGKLVAIHGIAPAYLQRAVFIVVLSFMFFMAMMFAFYIRQSVGYFLLSSAFLVLYLITMFSWVMQRKSIVQVYENGFKYKKQTVMWNEISGVNGNTVNIESGKAVAIPTTIQGFDKLLALIKQRSEITAKV